MPSRHSAPLQPKRNLVCAKATYQSIICHWLKKMCSEGCCGHELRACIQSIKHLKNYVGHPDSFVGPHLSIWVWFLKHLKNNRAPIAIMPFSWFPLCPQVIAVDYSNNCSSNGNDVANILTLKKCSISCSLMFSQCLLILINVQPHNLFPFNSINIFYTEKLKFNINALQFKNMLSTIKEKETYQHSDHQDCIMPDIVSLCSTRSFPNLVAGWPLTTKALEALFKHTSINHIFPDSIREFHNKHNQLDSIHHEKMHLGCNQKQCAGDWCHHILNL